MIHGVKIVQQNIKGHGGFCDLNGPYHKSAVKSTIIVGWYHFGNEYISLKSTRMMIRPKP